MAPAGRPRAYGLVMAAGAVAVAVGPLGGLFTTYLSWRLVFAGEVLIVLGILALTRQIEDEPPGPRPKIDLVGVVLSAAGLGLAVFGVLRSSVWGWVAPKPDAPELFGVSATLWLILGGLWTPDAICDRCSAPAGGANQPETSVRIGPRSEDRVGRRVDSPPRSSRPPCRRPSVVADSASPAERATLTT